MLRKADDPEQKRKPEMTVRSNRFFKLYNYWYFATREGATLGPFDTREQAIQATSDYIGFIETAPSGAVEMLQRNSQMAAGLH